MKTEPKGQEYRFSAAISGPISLENLYTTGSMEMCTPDTKG